MTRNTIPGTSTYAQCKEEAERQQIEAAMRATYGDAAFDSVPDAAPRATTTADMRGLGKAAPKARTADRARRRREVKARRRRERVLGDGRSVPLDRNAKARIVVRARVLMRPTEKGKHWGQITAKAYDVLMALLWGFHNARDGRCFPSYEAIAERAKCHRGTVAEAIRALEDAGLLTWVNRLKHIWEPVLDMFGQWSPRKRVVRTSNAYRFIDPYPSKSELPSGTSNQHSFMTSPPLADAAKIRPQQLEAAVKME
jgi:hypothetical protein